MQIKIQHSVAGHADPRYDLPEFSFAPGQVVDVHLDLAQAWLASGVAVAFKPRPDTPSPTSIPKPDRPIRRG